MEQGGGSQSPGGIPISSRIVVPSGASFDPVRRALAAIDAVHGDGDLPRLPVVRTRGTMEVGAYEWSDRTGAPLRLRFSGIGDHPELTVVHEIGHLLDHQALGQPGTFASERGGAQSVMEAIRLSAASRTLVLLRRRRIVILEERGRRVVEPVKQSLVAYYMQPREQFARAYAQYVSRLARADDLTEQLLELRRSRAGSMYHLQWTDADFEPISMAFDKLFRRRRWVISRLSF
jgi:hypothetical protein